MTDFGQLDELIRSGQLDLARRELKGLVLSSVKRKDYAHVANLARRVGLFQHSIRLLNPVIRPVQPLVEPASEAEILEYAMSLIKIGSIQEGRQLLEQVKSEPQATLFTAFSYFPEWDYQSAAKYLERYLKVPNLDSYQKLVAEVNLAAACLSLDLLENAESLLQIGLEQARGKGYRLLEGNLLELYGQLCIRRRDFGRAQDYLSQSAQTLGKTTTADELFVRKWLAVMQIYKSPNEMKSHQGIESLREFARSLKHWETLRDLDFHLAISTRDLQLLQHLFFGTPHLSYRERLLRQFPDAPVLPLSYHWDLGPPNPKALVLRERDLKGKKLLQLLLSVLASDFYQPINLGRLASRLFPGEFYNPLSTPNRVHQVISRFRAEAVERNWDIRIIEADGLYSLDSGKGLKVEVSRDMKTSTEAALIPDDLLQKGSFTAKVLMEQLGCSLSSANRLIKKSMEQGLIEKVGEGRSSRYSKVLKKAS